jgi:cellulose synthase/poly-beta-1,6-N-acetylglucosamine synthase-like glycosyltransferase
MSDPRYSVIIPAYNAGRTIGGCLRALTDQSLGPDEYEVIVVDDGSRDDTAAVIRTYPVRYLHQQNRGPAAARNHGAREARGAIILFTDADCVPTRDWVDQMTKPFSNPEVTAVKGAYQTNQRSLFARFAQIEFEERFELLKRAPSIDMVDTYSAAYRREVFLGAGGFDECFPVANNEDTELSYKLARQGKKMVFNPLAVVFHLNHPDSFKRYSRLKFSRGYWRMVVYRRYPDKMVKDTYTPQTLKLQILFFFACLGWLPPLLLRPDLIVAPFALTAAAYVVSMAPFSLLAFRRDPLVGVFAPFLLSVRAAALGSGFAWGVLRREKGRSKP